MAKIRNRQLYARVDFKIGCGFEHGYDISTKLFIGNVFPLRACRQSL